MRDHLRVWKWSEWYNNTTAFWKNAVHPTNRVWEILRIRQEALKLFWRLVMGQHLTTAPYCFLIFVMLFQCKSSNKPLKIWKRERLMHKEPKQQGLLWMSYHISTVNIMYPRNVKFSFVYTMARNDVHSLLWFCLFKKQNQFLFPN